MSLMVLIFMPYRLAENFICFSKNDVVESGISFFKILKFVFDFTDYLIVKLSLQSRNR